MAKFKSQKKPPYSKYGLPWCEEHDAYAPRRYNPYDYELKGKLVAEYLCDDCYYMWSAEI